MGVEMTPGSRYSNKHLAHHHQDKRMSIYLRSIHHAHHHPNNSYNSRLMIKMWWLIRNLLRIHQ